LGFILARAFFTPFDSCVFQRSWIESSPIPPTEQPLAEVSKLKVLMGTWVALTNRLKRYGIGCKIDFMLSLMANSQEAQSASVNIDDPGPRMLRSG
jgi:hypothetical protein